MDSFCTVLYPFFNLILCRVYALKMMDRIVRLRELVPGRAGTDFSLTQVVSPPPQPQIACDYVRLIDL